jgi:hypothetical protein
MILPLLCPSVEDHKLPHMYRNTNVVAEQKYTSYTASICHIYSKYALNLQVQKIVLQIMHPWLQSEPGQKETQLVDEQCRIHP